MSDVRDELGSLLLGVTLAGSASVLALGVLRAVGLPDVYASVLGFSVSIPILLYAIRSSSRLDFAAYVDARGRTGVVLDAVFLVLVGAIAGSAVTFAGHLLGLPDPWPQSLGIGSAVSAANVVFFRRNRSYFEGSPWLDGRLAERFEG